MSKVRPWILMRDSHRARFTETEMVRGVLQESPSIRKRHQQAVPGDGLEVMSAWRVRCDGPVDQRLFHESVALSRGVKDSGTR